jgi:glycosyltransferase involved in cell wall biosynthesis
MGPLVSCIIPTYNRAHIVGRAIQSVLNQTYKNIEVIVIDDGSQDNTQEVVLSIKDERVRYIRLHRNFGAAFARNIGIANARGEFVAFLDSDDYFLPEKIEKQVELMLKDESIGVCYTEVYFEIDNGELVYKESPRIRGRIPEKVLYERILLFPPFIFFPTFLVRKYLLHNCKFAENKKVFEEVDFLIELSKEANFDFIPLPLYVINKKTNEQRNPRPNIQIRIKNYESVLSEYKFDILRLLGKDVISFRYNRLAWTAYKYGYKILAAKLLFKSAFETKSLKDFLKGISVILGLYEKYMFKKYGKERLEEFTI